MPSAFENQFSDVGVPQLKDQHGETVEFKSLSSVPEAAASWQSFTAISVDRDPGVRGESGEYSRKPVVMSVSSDDCASPVANVDKVRLDSDDDKVYLVSQSDPVGNEWLLYCV